MNCEPKDICRLIDLCQVADLNYKFTSEQIKFIADEIIKDYSEMTFETLKIIIMDGIKGKFDEDNYQHSINMRTIFKWIRRYYEINPIRKYYDKEYEKW